MGRSSIAPMPPHFSPIRDREPPGFASERREAKGASSERGGVGAWLDFRIIRVERVIDQQEPVQVQQ